MLSIGKDLVEVADKLGVIRAVKTKLIKQPDPAMDKLVAVLGEISKIYDVLQLQIKNLLSLYFDPSPTVEGAKSRSRERATLIELEGGELAAKMRRAKGSCSKIQNIYETYLDPWFGRVLSREETNDMFQFFHFFHGVDKAMVSRIEELANWLSDQALAIADLVDANNFAEANSRIKNLRNELGPARREIAEIMKALFDLEAEFTQASGAVGG